MAEISDLHSMIDAIVEAHDRFGIGVWWRGHAANSWQLVPGTFRAPLNHYSEKNMATRFVAKARSRRNDCPLRTEMGEWVMLMQHYRLPTRLLDWTEYPLVALFFAVDEFPDKAATLWAMDAFEMNAVHTKRRGLHNINSSNAATLFRQVMQESPKPISTCLALSPTEFDLRMLLQGSAFTIHDDNTPLESHKEISRFLIRFDIPPNAKKYIGAQLRLMGVKRSNLFPDLDHLAGEIAKYKFEEPEPIAAMAEPSAADESSSDSAPSQPRQTDLL